MPSDIAQCFLQNVKYFHLGFTFELSEKIRSDDCRRFDFVIRFKGRKRFFDERFKILVKFKARRVNQVADFAQGTVGVKCRFVVVAFFVVDFNCRKILCNSVVKVAAEILLFLADCFPPLKFRLLGNLFCDYNAQRNQKQNRRKI